MPAKVVKNPHITKFFLQKGVNLEKLCLTLQPIKKLSIMADQIILDSHGEMLMQQYQERKAVYERMDKIVFDKLRWTLKENGLYVNAIEHRIKTEKSLRGKLELKGAKYNSLSDITDILGLRIITFYTDEVDKVAAIVKHIFEVDWDESVDKRKLHDLTSFGYNSLHYICRIPKNLIYDHMMPELNEFRFELQMRTALQHVWSTIEHDIGYKGEVRIPKEYRRQFSRLAGMLELVDDEFSRLRTTLTDYRRRMQALVASGQLDEASLDTDSFRSYLEMKPFDRLNRRIAAANQAEIYPSPLMPFLPVLEYFHMETLGDVQRFIEANSDAAYQLALSQLALTDLDILSENIGLQNLCIVHALKNGFGSQGVQFIFDAINGKNSANALMADMIIEQAQNLPFMRKS